MSIKFNSDILAQGTTTLVKIAGDNLVASESARIGNPLTGSVFVTGADKKGLVWIHGIGAEIDSVYTAVSQLKSDDIFYGAPVRVRKGTNGYIIETTDPDTAPVFFAGTESRNDQTPVYPNQIMYGNLHPVEGTLQLLVIGAVYNETPIADQFTPDFGTDTVQDTTATNIVQPTNNNRAIGILVQIDDTGVLSYKQSAEFVASVSLSQAWREGLLPTRDSGKYRVGYVKFTAGATSFTYADISREFPEVGVTIPASGAPVDATYIVQTANATLTNEQVLGALSSGIVTVTTTTGVLSSVTAPSGAIVGTTDSQTLDNKTLTTPTIASLTNAQHNHTDAAGGGQLTDAALSSAVSIAKGGTGATTAPTARTNLGVVRHLIASGKLGSASASISISSIPATYQHLELVLSARGDITSGTTENVLLRFNTDSAGNYYRALFQITGAGTSAVAQNAGATSCLINGMPTSNASNIANNLGTMQIFIYNYADSGFRRRVWANSVYHYLATTAGMLGAFNSTLWNNTAAAISQIDLLPAASSNFVTGTTYELYGIGVAL